MVSGHCQVYVRRAVGRPVTKSATEFVAILYNQFDEMTDWSLKPL